MQPLIDLYKQGDTLHHAYLFIGHKVEEMVQKVKDFFEEVVGMKTSGNPDFWHGRYDTLTIDDARSIMEMESRKNIGGSLKVFVIEANAITEEAQNALLKVFEEPTQGTHFFVISPQDALLPTLRSRMQVLFHENEEETGKSILKLDMAGRLALVKEIADGISDEDKTKQDAIALLNMIETELHQKGAEASKAALEVCALTRSALYDRGAPVKMILENLVLSV